MKSKICKSIICTLLIISSLIGSVHCFAKSYTADEVNTLVGGIVAYRAASYNTKNEQGIIDYFASHEMTLGGEWYVLAFIQNGLELDYSSYEKNLIKYLKNNEVYSATSREKFALTLLALKSADSFSRQYIKDVTNEAIGKQGIMSLIFGLHLLNNGCKSSEYTPLKLADKIISLQNPDGGWANSGDKSDVDVTAMTLESLYPYRNSYSSQINKAVDLLSSKQSDNGDYQSYGAYNAESTAQVIIALSSLGINCSTDNRFIKNGNTVLDGLNRYRNNDGSYSHKYGEDANNSAVFQALNALVAYSRFLKGNGAFYSFDVTDEKTTRASVPDTASSSSEKEKTTKHDSSADEITSAGSVYNEETASQDNGLTNPSSNGNTDSLIQNNDGETSGIDETVSENGNTNTVSPLNGIPGGTNTSFADGIFLSKELKIKIAVSIIILSAAVLCSIILYILKKRNKKNFIVIAAAAIILIAGVFFIRIQRADDYYNSTVVKDNTAGVVTLSVRCDTIIGKDGAPDNPVILEKSEYPIKDGDTVYNILAEALQENGILFEHNSSYYISGINNLYEFQFGDLSGWMYRVNGETPSVGCGEYFLKDGDEIEWLYTCEIGNDLN